MGHFESIPSVQMAKGMQLLSGSPEHALINSLEDQGCHQRGPYEKSVLELSGIGFLHVPDYVGMTSHLDGLDLIHGTHYNAHSLIRYRAYKTQCDSLVEPGALNSEQYVLTITHWHPEGFVEPQSLGS